MDTGLTIRSRASVAHRHYGRPGGNAADDSSQAAADPAGPPPVDTDPNRRDQSERRPDPTELAIEAESRALLNREGDSRSRPVDELAPDQALARQRAYSSERHTNGMGPQADLEA